MVLERKHAALEQVDGTAMRHVWRLCRKIIPCHCARHLPSKNFVIRDGMFCAGIRSAKFDMTQRYHAFSVRGRCAGGGAVNPLKLRAS